MNRKSNLVLLSLLSASVFMTPVSAYATTGEVSTHYQAAQNYVDQFHPATVKLNQGKEQNIVTIYDDAYKKPFSSEIFPDTHDCNCEGGAGSYSDPYQLITSQVLIDGYPLEYMIRNGHLVIFERPGLYYYKQNAVHSWFNEASAFIASNFSLGYGTYASYQVVKKIPYVARLLDRYGQPAPYNFQDYAMLAGTYMASQQVPLWGSIISTPVPPSGTKSVLVYLSTTGADYTWYRRANFTLYPDNTVSVKTWTVY